MQTLVICPYCGTAFKFVCGGGTTCRNPDCKARISVNSKGEIIRSQPGNKK